MATYYREQPFENDGCPYFVGAGNPAALDRRVYIDKQRLYWNCLFDLEGAIALKVVLNRIDLSGAKQILLYNIHQISKIFHFCLGKPQLAANFFFGNAEIQ